MDKCFLCGRFVLGLSGQDSFLDSALLQPNDAVAVNHAFGACHLKCLVTSPWGEEWAVLRLRWLESSPQVIRIYNDTLHVAIVNKQTSNVNVVRSDGQNWEFRRRMVDKFHPIDHGWQVPVESEFNCQLPGYEALIHELQEELTARGEVSILKIVQQLDLQSVLLHQDVLRDAKFTVRPELRKYWTSSGISVHANYGIFVPNDTYHVWQHCLAFLSDHGSRST